jgi:hypothetical protein
MVGREFFETEMYFNNCKQHSSVNACNSNISEKNKIGQIDSEGSYVLKQSQKQIRIRLMKEQLFNHTVSS